MHVGTVCDEVPDGRRDNTELCLPLRHDFIPQRPQGLVDHKNDMTLRAIRHRMMCLDVLLDHLHCHPRGDILAPVLAQESEKTHELHDRDVTEVTVKHPHANHVLMLLGHL